MEAHFGTMETRTGIFATKLYDSLHELDCKKLDVIIAERLPDIGLGKSINDRLQRATFSS